MLYRIRLGCAPDQVRRMMYKGGNYVLFDQYRMLHCAACGVEKIEHADPQVYRTHIYDYYAVWNCGAVSTPVFPPVSLWVHDPIDRACGV